MIGMKKIANKHLNSFTYSPYHNCNFVSERRVADLGDQNGWLRLQIGAFGANRKKKTPVFPFSLETQGF